jgi:hypothetical protein
VPCLLRAAGAAPVAAVDEAVQAVALRRADGQRVRVAADHRPAQAQAAVEGAAADAVAVVRFSSDRA